MKNIKNKLVSLTSGIFVKDPTKLLSKPQHYEKRLTGYHYFLYKGSNILLESESIGFIHPYNSSYYELNSIGEETDFQLSINSKDPYNEDRLICLSRSENPDIIKLINLIETNRELAIKLLKSYCKDEYK